MFSKRVAATQINSLNSNEMNNLNSKENFATQLEGKFYAEACSSAPSNAAAPLKSYSIAYSFGQKVFDKTIRYYDQVNCQSSAGKNPLYLTVYYSYSISGEITNKNQLDIQDAFKFDYYPTAVSIQNYDSTLWSTYITKSSSANGPCSIALSKDTLNANKTKPTGQLDYLRDVQCSNFGLIAKKMNAPSQNFFDIIGIDHKNSNNVLNNNGYVANSLLYLGTNSTTLDKSESSKRPEFFYINIPEIDG